jgi:dTDP-4-amino-4,6-dideoxygalactose transaminase
MKNVLEQRASTILYHVLRSNESSGRWLLPANICPIVPLTFLKAGIAFEFADIDPRTLCLHERTVLTRIRDDPARYAGVLFVHTYGREQAVGPMIASVRSTAPRVLVIDDRCLCDPTFEQPPSSADVVLFSTGYGKPVDVGAGGYAFLRERVAYERRALPYVAEDLARLMDAYKSDIAARLRVVDAPGDWLDTSTPTTDFDDYRATVEQALATARAQRETIRRVYRSRLPASALLPEGDWRVHLRVPDRDRLVQSIFDAGLFASTHYAPLTGIFAGGIAPVAEALHATVVNLFDDRHFSTEQAETACDIVLRHLG